MSRFLTGPASILTVVFLIAGCTSSDDTTDESTTGAPATTVAPAATVAAAATTTTEATTTTAPTTTAATTNEPTTTGVSADAVVWPESGEAWDVLFIADNEAQGAAVVVEAYRQLAEDAVGAEVRELESPIPYPVVGVLLNALRDPDFELLSDRVRQAEIIVVSTSPRRALGSDEFGECLKEAFQEPLPPDPAVYETDEYSAVFRETLGDVYDEIERLRDGAPTVLIGIDAYNGLYAAQREAGIVDECRAFFEWFSSVQRDIAEEQGAMWVSTHDVINGPDHDIDALEAGSIGSSDAMPGLKDYEPNEVGSAMIADALANLGFEPNN